LGKRAIQTRLRRRSPFRAVFEPEWEEIPAELMYTRSRDASAKVRLVELTLTLRPEIAEQDARSILADYARSTCKESGVLRCDVLRPQRFHGPSALNSGAGFGEFRVWIVFETMSARAEHERTPHANTLRLLVDREGRSIDNAVELTTLAKQCRLYEPVWPGALNGWRTVTKYSEKLTYLSNEEESGIPRHSLDILASSVGLEDAVVLIATATAAQDDYMDSIWAICKRYAASSISPLDSWEAERGTVRAGILSSVGRPRDVILMQVFDRKYFNHSSFDKSLALDLLDENGWKVETFTSVFPDLAGWKVASLSDYTWNTPGVEDGELTEEDDKIFTRMRISDAYVLQEQELAKSRPVPAHLQTAGASSSSASGSKNPGDKDGALDNDVEVEKPATNANEESSGRPNHAMSSPLDLQHFAEKNLSLQSPTGNAKRTAAQLQQLHVRQGNGAFCDIEERMRDLCGLRNDSHMRVMAVSGWNEARLQPLVMEMDRGMDAGRISFKVGVSIYGASATLAKVAEGVSFARSHRADIIVAFGGGAAMDGAKAIAALLKLSTADVAKALTNIREEAMNGKTVCALTLGRSAAPLLLIPGTVGSGAELSEQAILNAKLLDGRTQRIAVSFDYAKAPRMAVIDPRLVIPRRMNSKDAAMGGLQSICFAIETLLCPRAPHQAVELAGRALLRGRDAIIQARREPESSDGPARHALVDTATFAALSRDACGGLGLATCLSFALLDTSDSTAIDMDAPLRTVLPRVTAAVLAEFYGDIEPCRPARLVLDNDDANGKELSDWLLGLAEDIGVPLVSAVGVHGRDIELVLNSIAHGGLVSQCTDSRLLDAEVLRRIVANTTAQVYEL
jgi:alcohol dehydrogenase class IV